MRIYLTGVEAHDPTYQPSCSKVRQPFKLLQNLQNFQISFKSKMASSSSALKSITNRPRITEASVANIKFTKPLEICSVDSKLRNPAAVSRLKNPTNLKVLAKPVVIGPRQQTIYDESKNNTANNSQKSTSNNSSVGSLTSSPKWSHIKNRFENGSIIEKTKLSRTSSLPNDETDDTKNQKSISKSLTSLVPESKFNVYKDYSSKDRSIEKCSAFTKPDISAASKSKAKTKSDVVKPAVGTASKSNAKIKSDYVNVKSTTCKDSIVKNSLKLNTPKSSASACRSPKNSKLNGALGKSSAQYTSNSPRLSPLHKSLTNSSVSLSSNSSKNSETEDTLTASGTLSCNSSKNSQTNIPSACDTDSETKSSPKSSLSNIPQSYTPKNYQLKGCSTKVPALHGTSSDRRFTNKVTNSRTVQKSEDKSLNDNQRSQNDSNNHIKKSLFSEKDRILLNNISNINKMCKISSSANSSNSSLSVNRNSLNTLESKTSVAESAEKIRDLVKNSPASAKTVWVKDKTGNWIKKADEEFKNNVQSKVANLRSKFLDSDKDQVLHLDKSVTTNNVPAKVNFRNGRQLAKSSTTSSICEKSFIDELKRSLDTQSKDVNPGSKPSECRRSFKRNSVDSNSKLNVVQRAILSYEGNISPISPETQRKLKFVNDKVAAQTDDSKILHKNVQNGVLNAAQSSCLPSTVNKMAQSVTKDNTQRPSEPTLPNRNFLNRYQLMHKDLKKSLNSKPSSKTKVNPASTEIQASTFKENTTPSQGVESDKNTSKSGDAKAQNRQNLILNLTSDSISLKSSNAQDSDILLLPNTSFLWRGSTAASDLSKSSTNSSVSLASSENRSCNGSYNYYSTVDLEIDKRSEISDEPIYIDSQESNSSDNYASNTGPYQNVPARTSSRNGKGCFDEWSDSDDDCIQSSVFINQNSTVKKKPKRSSNQRDFEKSAQNASQSKRQQRSDIISFTESKDTLINHEVGRENTFEVSDSDHFYEPVYESLGDYLRNPGEEEEDDDNFSLSLSPDDKDNPDLMHCSLTSLESAESGKQDKDDLCPSTKSSKNDHKKPNTTISQLKRHLSWTKNDIRLELSSKFNKIKIKKNGSTEIGVKVQEHDSNNTSPKKKTFIKCILKQKSSSSIPIKRSPSPKKESSMFYVHLTMGRENRPLSDSVIGRCASGTQGPGDGLKAFERPQSSTNGGQQRQRFRSDSGPLSDSVIGRCASGTQGPGDGLKAFERPQSSTNGGQQRPRFRKVTAGPAIQRPRTPPPLPPVSAAASKIADVCHIAESQSIKIGGDSATALNDEVDAHLYTCLDPDYFELNKTSDSTSLQSRLLRQDSIETNSRALDSGFEESLTPRKRSITSLFGKSTDSLSLPSFPKCKVELLKSPFEEEPMYQFYQKDAQQRATLWYSAVDGSESDFEDDASSKFSDTDSQPVARPVLQSQLSAMDLVHGQGGQRTLWCEVPEVVQSGILKTISSKDRKIQEAMFEVITSEASYLKSLNFLFEHFVQCTEFSGSEKTILDKREKHILFSDIQPVSEASAHLLADLEKRWLENIVISNICDIIYNHASKYFSVYVKYCSNQIYQERLLRELKEKRPEFVTVLKKLESNPVCQGLDMHSFLLLPMQRITRLPLLIDAIFHRLSPDSVIYESCKMALATLNKIVAECNEGARKMERMEEMLVISQQLDFSDCKGLGLLSASRWLVKKGELVQLLLDSSNRRTFGRSSRWSKIQLYLFLFTDILVVTRKKSDDSYSVVDFCPRNMLQVLTVDENMPPFPIRLPSSYRNLFQMIMLSNKDGKTAEMLLSCLLESDRTRWIDAMTPVKSENPDEKIYEEWDWPQFQCTRTYNAQQPDELSLEEADVVNVFRKMADGWFEGERIRDGVRGWFPSSHAVEIITSHVRARNLRQRYRLLMLSQTYLEEQYKNQAQLSKK